jgi:hypothetical protein
VKVVYVAKRKAKTILSALWNSFSPFPYQVWLIILAFLIIQATYATLVRYFEWKMGHERVFYPLEKYWQYLKCFLLQPEETTAFKSAAGLDEKFDTKKNDCFRTFGVCGLFGTPSLGFYKFVQS